jgi:hypothetical protein
MITVIYFWRIKLIYLPLAIFHMGFDHLSLIFNRKIKFYKLLGTGKGETFTPRDADPRRWGLIVTLKKEHFESFNNSGTVNSWRKFAKSEYRAILQPISSKGSWSAKNPFAIENSSLNWDGPIAAITRARIKWRLNNKFWRAVPPVTLSLKSTPGLLSAIGIGEAPIGLQGTFSRWQSASAIKDFAYRGAAHQKAITQTSELDWYAEELFARFAIIEEHGTL